MKIGFQNPNSQLPLFPLNLHFVVHIVTVHRGSMGRNTRVQQGATVYLLLLDIICKKNLKFVPLRHTVHYSLAFAAVVWASHHSLGKQMNGTHISKLRYCAVYYCANVRPDKPMTLYNDRDITVLSYMDIIFTQRLDSYYKKNWTQEILIPMILIHSIQHWIYTTTSTRQEPGKKSSMQTIQYPRTEEQEKNQLYKQ